MDARSSWAFICHPQTQSLWCASPVRMCARAESMAVAASFLCVICAHMFVVHRPSKHKASGSPSPRRALEENAMWVCACRCVFSFFQVHFFNVRVLRFLLHVTLI